jgi:hypothetical protein
MVKRHRLCGPVGGPLLRQLGRHPHHTLAVSSGLETRIVGGHGEPSGQRISLPNALCSVRACDGEMRDGHPDSIQWNACCGR